MTLEQLQVKDETIQILTQEILQLRDFSKQKIIEASNNHEKMLNKLTNTIEIQENEISELREENTSHKISKKDIMSLHKSVVNIQNFNMENPPENPQQNLAELYWITQQANVIEDLLKNGQAQGSDTYNDS